MQPGGDGCEGESDSSQGSRCGPVQVSGTLASAGSLTTRGHGHCPESGRLPCAAALWLSHHLRCQHPTGHWFVSSSLLPRLQKQWEGQMWPFVLVPRQAQTPDKRGQRWLLAVTEGTGRGAASGRGTVWPGTGPRGSHDVSMSPAVPGSSALGMRFWPAVGPHVLPRTHQEQWAC